MTRTELINFHDELTKKARELMLAKNNDYNADDDPFGNLSACEIIDISALKGILVRMLDKIKRLDSFASDKAMEVSDEKLEDTAVDLMNYCVLFAAYSLAIKGVASHETENVSNKIWPNAIPYAFGIVQMINGSDCRTQCRDCAGTCECRYYVNDTDSTCLCLNCAQVRAKSLKEAPESSQNRNNCETQAGKKTCMFCKRTETQEWRLIESDHVVRLCKCCKGYGVDTLGPLEPVKAGDE